MIGFRHHTGKAYRRGFTLTELALALLIVSVIVGAIWAAAGKTWGHYRTSRSIQEMTTIAQNIREFYISTNQVPGGNITTTLDNNNLIPTEMRRTPGGGNPIDNPFNSVWPNGSLIVMGNPTVNGSAIAGFRMRFMGLTSAACIDLLTTVPIKDADLGIVQAGAQNMAAGTTAVVAGVSASAAETWCNLAGANNEADWDFKLRN